MENVEFKLCPTYKGKPFKLLAEMQEAAIGDILNDGIALTPGDQATTKFAVAEIIDKLVANKVMVVQLLTLTDASRPKARGLKKPRKSTTSPGKETA